VLLLQCWQNGLSQTFHVWSGEGLSDWLEFRATVISSIRLVNIEAKLPSQFTPTPRGLGLIRPVFFRGQSEILLLGHGCPHRHDVE